MKVSKYTENQRKEALEMLSAGATHTEVSERTGVEKKHLIVWKSRMKANKSITDSNKSDENLIDDLQKKLSDAEFTYNSHLNRLEKELEFIREKYNQVVTDTENVEKTFVQEYSLPFALMLLHISAIYGVSHVLEMLLHSKAMAILTGIVICSSGLVIFASNKASKNLSMLTIFSVFIIEFVCNLITIQSVMDVESYNKIRSIGCEPFYIFLILSFLLPALNLKLEIIMFEKDS